MFFTQENMASFITRENLCGVSEYSASAAGLLRFDDEVTPQSVIEADVIAEDDIHEIDLWVA